ncbi:MAG: RapZ C-terminal domain-containing protein [Candidatus Dormibacteraceae bacterium]
MSVVILGGSDLGQAAEIFKAEGYPIFSGLPVGIPDPKADVAVVRHGGLAEMLREADLRHLRYVLVHVGEDDGELEGSFARAHHRALVSDLTDLARRLRSRERMLVTTLAFGFKQGLPEEANWVIDTRFLDNPYWDLELRPLTGFEDPVRDHVLGQPAAMELLDNLEQTLRVVIPRWRGAGRPELVIAFGCTGGRHRSVVLAAEMARRLAGLEEVEVQVRARDL